MSSPKRMGGPDLTPFKASIAMTLAGGTFHETQGRLYTTTPPVEITAYRCGGRCGRVHLRGPGQPPPDHAIDATLYRVAGWVLNDAAQEPVYVYVLDADYRDNDAAIYHELREAGLQHLPYPPIGS